MSGPTRRRGLAAILVVAAAVSAAPPAGGASGTAPNIVENGSFESPVLAPFTFQVVSSMPGWTTSSGPGIEIQNGTAGSPVFGNQFVELDSHGSSAMYQDLSTEAGRFYCLSFQFSPRPFRPASDNVLDVRWDGSSVDTVSADGTGKSNTDWNQHVYTLQASSSTTRLEFADLGTSNTLGTYLDDVIVTLVPFDVCALYDEGKAHKGGSTVPVRIQLCDPDGGNASSSSIGVQALGLVRDGSGDTADAECAGQSNADGFFRYDDDLGGYVFNLKTGNLSSGTWRFQFLVAGDPFVYEAAVVIR